MPLRDHFRPPMSEHRHGESFHSLWTGQIVRTLNRRLLPAGYFAENMVTTRRANLHNELMAFLGHPPEFQLPADAGAYPTAYRPSQPAGVGQLELWLHALAVGQRLPILPLALRGGPTLPLDLEATYAEALLDLRL